VMGDWSRRILLVHETLEYPVMTVRKVEVVVVESVEKRQWVIRGNDRDLLNVGIREKSLRIPYPLLLPLRPMFPYLPLLVLLAGLLKLPILPPTGQGRQGIPGRSDRLQVGQIDRRILVHLYFSPSASTNCRIRHTEDRREIEETKSERTDECRRGECKRVVEVHQL